MVDLLETLVRLESPSTDKAAVDRCGEAIADRLQELGAVVERLHQAERGDHIRASFSGTPGAPQVLLLGHFDTVWDVGQLERMPLRIDGGRLHGPGVFDMKGGIAVAMQAVRVLRESAVQPVPRLVMLWTTDEEVGSGTSRALIEEEAQKSAAVLVLEPSLPGGAAKTSRKACGDFHVVVRGRSAHAGIDPGKGSNAVHELARQVLAIEALQDLDRGVSVNVGIVRGGARTNVIPDMAEAFVDARAPTKSDAVRVDAAMRGLEARTPGTSVHVTGGFGRPPLERSAGVIRLYEEARAAAAELGMALGEGATGGGSDGNFTAALGVPTVDGLGPQGDGAHALHEHVIVADLAWRAAFLARLVARLGGPTR